MELPLRVSSASPHDETPQSYSRQTAEAAPPIQRRQSDGLCCHTYLHRTGILTGFPIGPSELPGSLGSPNPQLKNVAEETLLYQVSGILVRICCY